MTAKQKLVILAGEGKVPAILTEEAMRRGVDTYFIPVVPDFFQPQTFTKISSYIPATKINILLRMIKEFGADEVILIGKVPRRIVDHARFRDYDLRSFWLKKRLLKEDAHIFQILDEEFRKEGLVLVSQAKYLENLLDFSGILTKNKPSKHQIKDIALGLAYARELAKLNIGQTVVVKKGIVVSVEAVDGMDSTIRRAKEFIGERGGVVCKVEKPLQDLRFDIPTVGMETLRLMKDTGCDVLAIEEKKTFMVDFDDMIRFANDNKIIIVAQKVEPLHRLFSE